MRVSNAAWLAVRMTAANNGDNDYQRRVGCGMRGFRDDDERQAGGMD